MCRNPAFAATALALILAAPGLGVAKDNKDAPPPAATATTAAPVASPRAA